MILNDALLQSWIDVNFNALFRGRRGTGKTARITKAFTEKFGNNWLYYSSATLDPWTDLVGVPKEGLSKSGKACINYVLPERLVDDQIEAIFFDELNRAKPKVIDAVLELIQFKSINGRKFPNLKIVWAAINPKNHDGGEDEEYQVEELDPAVVDRFHIHVDVPYALEDSFFYDNFPEYADSAILWWNNLGKKDQKIQNMVSPRRLEYALRAYQAGLDMSHVLPEGCGVAVLHAQLKNGNYRKRMQGLAQRNDATEIRKALLNENFFDGIKEEILKDKALLKIFAPHFPNEKFNSHFQTNPDFKNCVFNNRDVLEAGKDNLLNIIEANKAPMNIIKEIKNKLMEENMYTQTPYNTVVDNHYQDLGPDFFKNQQAMMRIAGVFHQNPTNVESLDADHLLRALVITLCLLVNVPFVWLSIKIGLKNIKNAGEKLGISFKDLMKQAVEDEQYKKFCASDPSANSKIQNVFHEEKLLASDSSGNEVAKAAQTVAASPKKAPAF